MRSNMKLLSVVAIALMVLAGCDDDDVISGSSQGGGTGAGTGGGVGGGGGGGGAVASIQDQFGASFAAAFNAGRNDPARALADLTVIFNGIAGVNPTAAPVDL